MYTFTVTPVINPSSRGNDHFSTEVKHAHNGVTVSRAWTGTMEEAARWAIEVIKRLDRDHGLTNEQFEKLMRDVHAETRVTTGNGLVNTIEEFEDACKQAEAEEIAEAAGLTPVTTKNLWS